jgi:hypothetical protein
MWDVHNSYLRGLVDRKVGQGDDLVEVEERFWKRRIEVEIQAVSRASNELCS